MKRFEIFIKDNRLYLELHKENQLPILCDVRHGLKDYNLLPDDNGYTVLDSLFNSEHLMSMHVSKYIKLFNMKPFDNYITTIKHDIKENNGANAKYMRFVVDDFDRIPISCSIKFIINYMSIKVHVVFSMKDEYSHILKLTFIPKSEHMTIEKDLECVDTFNKIINDDLYNKACIIPNELFLKDLRQFVIDEFNKIKDKEFDSDTEIIRKFCEDIEKYTKEEY